LSLILNRGSVPSGLVAQIMPIGVQAISIGRNYIASFVDFLGFAYTILSVGRPTRIDDKLRDQLIRCIAGMHQRDGYSPGQMRLASSIKPLPEIGNSESRYIYLGSCKLSQEDFIMTVWTVLTSSDLKTDNDCRCLFVACIQTLATE